MRKTLTFAIVAIVALATAGSVVTAQMMGSGHMMDQNKPQTDSTAGMSHNMMGMSGDMPMQCAMMSSRLEHMQKQFDRMMTINDMPALKRKMQQYRETMQTYMQEMAQHQQMCRQMMSNMSSDNKMMNGGMMNKADMKCGMMGNKKGGTMHNMMSPQNETSSGDNW